VLERFPRKTYFDCPDCGIISLVFFGARATYAKEYFFSHYRDQYGKTYLEDFDHIRRMGEGRLARIRKISRHPWSGTVGERPRLLDIGPAFGPFLAAARDRDMAVRGLEISAEAAAYIRNELGIECLEGDFETEEIDIRLREKSFDIITMWYVLEHFIPTGMILRKVNRLLRRGGVFALATPSGAGVSRRKNPRAFFERSPDDHFTVWTPHTARRALRRFGFRVRKTVVTGHHPERFFSGQTGPRRLRLAALASRLCGRGDTFELYAVKERECE
jgi:2-polyprenyl-3-methyl-5-hydroxy-6-metoxy-1,4-benzoquinol methylase